MDCKIAYYVIYYVLVSIELICTDWFEDAGYQAFLVPIDKRIRHFQDN